MQGLADGRVGARPPGRGVLWGAFGISRLHRSGAVPHRVLVLGSRSLLRSASRSGVLTQLTEDLADRIWLSTRRGVDLDVVWELRRLLRSVLNGLTALRIARYDTVVLLEASGLRGRTARSSRLIRAILQEMAPTGRFLSVTLDVGRSGGDGPSEAAGGREDGVESEPDEIRPLRVGLESRKKAAAAIAGRLQMPRLEAVRRFGAADAGPDDDDAQRDTAVAALPLTGRPDDERLQLLVERARDTFDARFAELNVVGRSEQWSLAAAGLARGTRSTERSLCDLAVRRSAPTIIHDTLRELAVDRIPRLPDGRMVRFYAGHPIQSIDGYRIGVLCVYDTRPHRLDDEDVSALRDLALLAESRLIGV